MRSTISIPLCIAGLLSACPSDDGGEPVASSTTAGESGSETGHADHADEPGEGGSSTQGATTGSTSAAGDDTGPAASTDEATGTTGAVAMDTWESWALPQFFEVYCNQCHPGESTRDFSVYEMVVANEEHIRCGVAPEAIASCDPGHIEPGHLPIGPGPYPSDDERWRLVDWVLAGMPRD